MSDHVARFLIALSQDPAGMADFLKDPDLVLAHTDLTAEEKEVVKSGDVARICRSLGLETEKGALYTASVTSQSQSSTPPPDRRERPKPPKKPTPPPQPGKPPKKAVASV